MGIVKLNTGFNIEVDFNIAPFHKRLFAWCLDIFILIAYIMIIGKLLNGLLGDGWDDEFGWISVLYWIPVLLYTLVCEVMLNGQTIGKKVLRIKVITVDGGQPTISQYLLRYIFKTIDFPYWLLFAVIEGNWPWYTIFFVFGGLVCFIYSPKSQRIGDLLAGTMVIDTRTQSSWQDTAFIAVENDYIPLFPQVMKMSDRDMNTIRQVLNAAASTRDYAYANRICAKIKSALHIQSDMDAFELMEVLLKDYNYISSR